MEGLPVELLIEALLEADREMLEADDPEDGTHHRIILGSADPR